MMRPYFNYSIEKLERIFEGEVSTGTLALLLDELAFRKTPRAVALRRRVQQVSDPAKWETQEIKRLAPQQGRLFPNDRDSGGERAHRVETLPGKRPALGNGRRKRLQRDFPARIQPPGVDGRPHAFKPTLKDNLDLDLAESDGHIVRFCVALTALIQEMRRRGAGRTQFILENGSLVSSELMGFSYKFAFTEDANIFDGARVELLVGGQVVPGRITAIMHDCIVVTLREDYGKVIHSCILRIDNTALLEALLGRLEAIQQGDDIGFQNELAEKVLTNDSNTLSTDHSANWPWHEDPTKRQNAFLDVALNNEISWLWGPPGTGKTNTLSALVQVLYAAGERVLICSNTNQAVDQLLLKLCRNARDSEQSLVESGHVIRDGRIEGRLQHEFGEFVSIDGVAKRRMAQVKQRYDDLQAELLGIERELAMLKIDFDAFQILESLRNEGKSVKNLLRASSSEIEKIRAMKGEAEAAILELKREYRSIRNAGAIRRMFLRSENQITSDIGRRETQIEHSRQKYVAAHRTAQKAKGRYEILVPEYRILRDQLSGKDRNRIESSFKAREARKKQILEELQTIQEQLDDASKTILSEARIVGTTVTRAYLRPSQFSSFDTVLIDEASMILLPAVFHAAGLATRRVVVTGDFQQLPPIVQTEQKSIHDILAHSVFEEAGIRLDPVLNGSVPRLVMLDEQFRMDRKICDLVSTTFYKGRLRTHAKMASQRTCEPAPFSNPLTIVDTSQISPFVTRDAFQSRLNLMHGLIVRNIILFLQDRGRLFDEDQKSRIGVCTPYRAQADVIRSIGKKSIEGEIRTSTVHGFQGDERGVMILDLVDSFGERDWRCGLFLQATDLNESGAKLLNVAMSRAESCLVIIGNLAYLDQKLPSDAFLRRVLYHVQSFGEVVDARDVLAWYPIIEDLDAFGNQFDVDPDLFRNSVVHGREFERLCYADIDDAKESVVVFSGFVTVNRVARLAKIFRALTLSGVRIRCVTRPPDRNGRMPLDEGRKAIQGLEDLGVTIDLRSQIHEKVVIIDNRIVWFGSLNP